MNTPNNDHLTMFSALLEEIAVDFHHDLSADDLTTLCNTVSIIIKGFLRLPEIPYGEIIQQQMFLLGSAAPNNPEQRNVTRLAAVLYGTAKTTGKGYL